ncbi:toprim domain-containing protein [Allorhodopirellula solitaria]|nr:toprim domain-containing protein [Allorhodopirellula solitaria]
MSKRSLPPSSHTECLIVEGDSAAKSVDQVRDARQQAILALQGKPLNAVKASRQTAMRNAIFQRILETLLGYRASSTCGASVLCERLADPAACVYDRLILLMDPDADGIHCGVLMMAFFRRFAPELIRTGRLSVVRPPMFVFRLPDSADLDVGQWPVASSPEHAAAIEQTLREHGVERFEKTRHRGLGSLDSSLLGYSSVTPATRRESSLTLAEIDAAIAMFGG